ncbi:intracellular short-chain-length polyhydroxyalkanoate depolymerase [Oceanobacillus saliphilus]|uniref:intracellular short-chain-length polyhydroxyalkanoate depolymerase n=1 Tax=Oceanobacillus saliphilus TaxID=2925834 RepID=UPI00201E27D8|nr:alpha/beta hydrolase [Oceanobacillus saliphilus]
MRDVVLKKVTLSNGESIAYREREGGQDVVVLVHGNMTSSVHWDLVIENISPDYKVYAVDLRGFGESSYESPISAIKDFSDDLKLFADKLQLKNFALVGWSLGGTVCQQFCADYPSYCNRLFLLASGSSRGYAFYPLGEDGLPDVNNRLKTLEQIVDDDKTKIVQTAYDTLNYDFLKQIWDMSIYVNNQPDAERYQKYLEDMTTQRNLAACYQALNIFNISDTHNGLVAGENRVKDIDIPVMIAWGEHDMVVTKQMTDELIEDFGEQAVYKELKGCGHSPLIDDLGQLLQVMEEFLAEERIGEGNLK